MGVVNVTPDSFSDGGVHLDPDVATAAARTQFAQGAAIVDIGGESTRPGSEGVSADDELRRVVPVLEALAGEVPVSIDTAKAEVARRAIALGAELVNDVTALRSDPELAGVVADAGAYLCLMHMQGEPRTMQVDPRYDDVVDDVKAFLEERLRVATGAGVDESLVCLDPGIGFGKTVAHNFELVRRLDELAALGRPVVIGFSRKSSLGRILGDPNAKTGPLAASLARRRRRLRARRHDHPRARRPRARRGARRRAGGDRVSFIVELHDLRVPGRHGVLEHERESDREFLYDIAFDVSDAALSDRIEDAVDYRDVAQCVREVSEGRRYHLIEALAAATAEAIVGRFPVEWVRVKVRKPNLEVAGLQLGESVATCERAR